MVFTLLLVCYLSIHAVVMALRPGLGLPRQSATELVKLTVEKASSVSNSKEILDSEWRLLHTLHIVGPHAEIYGYLARIAYERQQLERANYFAQRSLELDHNNEAALQVSKSLEKSKI